MLDFPAHLKPLAHIHSEGFRPDATFIPKNLLKLPHNTLGYFS